MHDIINTAFLQHSPRGCVGKSVKEVQKGLFKASQQRCSLQRFILSATDDLGGGRSAPTSMRSNYSGRKLVVKQMLADRGGGQTNGPIFSAAAA